VSLNPRCSVVGVCQRSEGEHRWLEEEGKDQSEDNNESKSHLVVVSIVVICFVGPNVILRRDVITVKLNAVVHINLVWTNVSCCVLFVFCLVKGVEWLMAL